MSKQKFEEVNEAVMDQELEESTESYDETYTEEADVQESGIKRFGKAVVKGACAVGRGVKKAVPAIAVGAVIIVGGAVVYAWNKAKESVDGIEDNGGSESSDSTQSENEATE